MDALGTKRKIRISLAIDGDESGPENGAAPSNHAKSGGRQSRKGHVREFVALSSVPVVLVLGNSMLVPILPDMEKEMGISHFQSSLVITLFSLAAAIVIPLAGYLSDRFSRKAVIIPSLILYGGAGVLAGLGAVWGSYPLLIVSRAAQGIGAAGTAPIAMALTGDMYKDKTESQALGLMEAANGTGKVASPILGSLLALLVWYAAFFAFPVFCLLSLLAMLFLIKEPKRTSAPKPVTEYIRAVRKVFREHGKWMVASFFSGSLALFILFGALFFLSDILEEPPQSIDGIRKGFVLAIPLLGMVAASWITGTVIRKNGILIRRLTNIGLAMMAASLAAAIWLHQNPYALIGLLTVSSIGTGMLLPSLNTMITGAVDKSERGMITSLYSSLRFFGVAAGPPFFGWLMEISRSIVFVAVSALALIALGLVFFLVKPGRQVK